MDVLSALERNPRGTPNASLRRKWQDSLDTYIRPTVEFLSKNMMNIVVLVLLLIVIKIYAF